jgi:hypothetical protein
VFIGVEAAENLIQRCLEASGRRDNGASWTLSFLYTLEQSKTGIERAVVCCLETCKEIT